jgi:two-component system, sensor histidine kinase PdtaS
VTQTRILIAEDELITSMHISKTLENLGYCVAGSVVSGEEAVAKAQALNPHLVLLDIHLEGAIDGIDAAKEIRGRLGIPVVYLTALSDNATIDRAKETDPFGFVIKPFDERILHITIEMALHKQKLEAQRNMAEEGLARNEKRLSLIYETVGDIIFGLMVEPEGIFRFDTINPAFCRVTGLTPDQVLGKTVQEVIPEPSLTMVVENYHRAIRENRNCRWEETSDYPAGRLTGEVTIAPNFDKNGVCTYLIGSVHDITERKLAEDRLRATLSEKEVLLKEVHHRVKNNLQIVSSLLSIQMKQFDDPLLRAAFQASRDRMKSIALIHEKLYRSQNIAEINFATYMHDVITLLFQSYGNRRITYSIESSDVHIGLDKAVPLSLVVTELVSNALKHAFPNKREGAITINLDVTATGDSILAIHDNGIGFPQDLLLNDLTSLGLTLVKALVEQIEGTIEVRRDEGTTFVIAFKPE